jgi:hypothetical protein
MSDPAPRCERTPTGCAPPVLGVGGEQYAKRTRTPVASVGRIARSAKMARIVCHFRRKYACSHSTCLDFSCGKP